MIRMIEIEVFLTGGRIVSGTFKFDEFELSTIDLMILF